MAFLIPSNQARFYIHEKKIHKIQNSVIFVIQSSFPPKTHFGFAAVSLHPSKGPLVI